MPGRRFSAGTNYRYGFNGQEKSTEIAENTMTAEFWEFDTRIGRRWNLDPKPNISISSYTCFGNNPISYIDALGDSITPSRTRGMNFIVVPTKAMRDADIAEHGKIASAYYWDYKKAKKMERKSKGTLKVIEADDACVAIDQIKSSLKPNEYVANLVIDFHRGSGPFDDPQFDNNGVKSAFNDLANGYIGKGCNVYLGMCWSGGNDKTPVPYVNLTQRASDWLDGATTYGHQSAASSVSFFLSNNFSGPVWEDYGKTEGNLARRRYHTISYYDPKLKTIRSVEIKMKIYIRNSGEIHPKQKINLGSLPTITPYGEIPKLHFAPPSTSEIPPPLDH
jgi:hypothetical protein